MILADLMHGTATTGTGPVSDLDHDLDPRQMRWQRTTIAPGRCGSRWICVGRGPRRQGRLQAGHLFRNGLFQILDALFERRTVELFGAAAEPVALDPQ